MLRKTKGFVPLFTAVLFCLRPALSHASWGTSTLDDAAYAGQYTSIAVDVNDNIHVAYVGVEAADWPRYAKYDGSSWTFEDVDTISSFKYTSIVVDVNGNPHIAYYDFTNGNLKYATSTASGWGTQVVDSVGDVGQYSSLALDGRGYPHIAYYDATNTNLKYAKWSGSGWDIQTVDSEDTSSDGKYCSIALDGFGNPHISYSKETTIGVYNTKYAKWTPLSGWGKETVDTSNSGKNTSIAIDGNGTVHISYDDTGTEILYAQSLPDSSWELTSCFFGAVTGVSSIALDGNGNPHIVYHKPSTDFSIVYSSYPNWSSSTVEFGAPSRDMGNSNSLAFDSDGRACIVYSSYNANSSNYDLRFATSSFTFAAPMCGNSRSKVQAPTNFGGAAISATQINWSWTNNSSNAIGYRVYCSSAGGNFYLAIDTAALTGNVQTSANHTGLCPNTSYQAYAAAVNAGGVVTSSSSLVWTPANPPTGSYVVSRSSYSITLQWADNNNTYYTRWGILRSTDNFVTSTTTVKSFVSNYTVTNCTNTELNPNTTYWYKIYAYNEEDETETTFDATVSTKTLPSSPVAAGLLLGTGISTTSINWTWMDTNSDATQEDVYRIKSQSDDSILTELDPNTTFWLQTGLSVNISTSVYIEAHNESGTSVTAAETSYALANPPTGAVIVSRSSFSVTITWSDNDNPSYTKWGILHSTDNYVTSTTTVKNFSNAYTSTSATDTALSPNTTYWYKVQAFNGDGIGSSYGNILSTITLDGIGPSAITDLSGTAGTNEGELTLTWTAPGNDGTLGIITGGQFAIQFSTYNECSWGYGQAQIIISTTVVPSTQCFYTLTGLSGRYATYVKIWTADEFPNWSLALESSQAQARGFNPASIDTLSAITGASIGEIDLTWTAPGDDGTSAYVNNGKWRIAYTYSYPYTFSSPEQSDGDWSHYYIVISTSFTPAAVHNYTITGLVTNTDYYFRMWAADENPLWSGISNEATDRTLAIDATKPGDITDLAAFPGDSIGEIKLTWTAPGNDGYSGTASYYDIRYLTDSSITEASWDDAEVNAVEVFGAVIPDPLPAGTTQSLVITGLTAGTKYYFAIKTYDDADNESDINTNYSDSWSYPKSSESPPAPPPSLTGAAAGVAQINWLWTDTANELGYKLYDDQNNLIASISADTETYTESGFQPNTQYTRYLVAWNAGGDSTPTATASCYTLADQPAGLTSLQITDHTIKLSWISANATYFRLLRSTTVVTNVSTTTYTDTALPGNSGFSYKVESYNSEGVLNTGPGDSNVIGAIYTLEDTTAPQAPSIAPPAAGPVQPGGSITLSGTALDAAGERFSKIIITIYDQDNRVLWSDSMAPGASGVRPLNGASFFTNSLSISAEGVISGTIDIASNFSDYFPMATEIKIGIQLEDDGTNRSPEPVPSALPVITVAPSVTSPKATVYNSLIKTPGTANPAVIRYELPSPGFVSVKLYDLQGRLVKTIFEGQDSTNVKYWYGKNSAGNTVASGVYLLHIKAGGVETVKKIVVVK
ncbi:MAG: fibronectin type III domain-containing protein [bacterium]